MSKLPYTLIAMLTVTTGTMFLMWIGEQITQRGIGKRYLAPHFRRDRGTDSKTLSSPCSGHVKAGPAETLFS
jgi:hypothetical protein